MPRTLLPEDLLSHAAWMRSLARSLVRDEASADDIVQETFAAVAERAPERPRAVGAWLRGVLFNLVRRSRRSEVRTRRREERVARPERDVSTPADIVERAELQRRVVDEVIALAEPYRTAVLLRYFDDLSPADIARREDVPVATVRTRLQRGLEKLRRRLDRLQGGDRAAWCALLAPLAGWQAASGTAGGLQAAEITGGLQAAVADGAAECAGGGTLAAGGAAASGGTKAIILGGALMTQKTVFAAAAVGIVALAAGLGIGHLGTRRHETAARFEAEARKEAEAELARLRAALDRESAAREKSVEEKDALAARVEALDRELAEGRERLALAAAKEEEAEARRLPISFGEFVGLEGLQEADWPEMAQALRAMNGLFVDLVDKLEKGEPIDPELQKKIAAENAKLVKLAAQVMGKIPTNLPVNGEFTHPLVLANLMSAVLEESGLPLDERQAAALERLGSDYEAGYARKQEGYSDGTLALEKVVDELELKDECVRKIREALSPQQRDAVVPPELAGMLQLDVLSPGVATLLTVQPKQFGSAEEARASFQERMLKDLRLDDPSSPQVRAAFDDWYLDIEPLLAPRPGTREVPPQVEDVIRAGRAQANFLRSLLEWGGLGQDARARILARQDWMVPQVVEKADG